MHRGRALFLSIALCTGACDGKPDDSINGYAEGDFVRVALPAAGIVTNVAVREGQEVKAGDPLFTLDGDAERAALRQAEARREEARAVLANLSDGKRQTEIRAQEAELRQAEADLRLSQSQYTRQQALEAGGHVSKARLDEARAAIQRDNARAAAAAARLATSRQHEGRRGEIQAAAAALEAADAAVDAARVRLEQRSAHAPAAGRVEDVLFRPGEGVAAGQAVVSLLPPENLRIRIFASPGMVARLPPGSRLAVQCRGCPDTMTARVGHVANQATYAPPVLYSRDRQDKLVFLVEAVPEVIPAPMRPGQPVTVTIPRGTP